MTMGVKLCEYTCACVWSGMYRHMSVLTRSMSWPTLYDAGRRHGAL